ncbi:MAG: TPM domain-containing protein [Bacteroidetes bacterium]|nr:TPM domain-containing protein [Bacteroidota bacterium]MBK8657967.1 TPM domain-containing protein [Bacteroidota bacterium]
MLFNKSFFSSEEKKAIVKAIGEAEAMTSGEIRVHVEARCKNENVLDRAVEIFYQLNMDKTAQQNGVLIYLAYEDHKFAILGDKGINHVVPANFWDSIKEVMREHFQKHEFFQGVVFAIKETGFHLKQYFPLQHNDKNELSNEISEG